MRPQVRTFKMVAVEVCGRKRFSFVEFMQERGLEAILIDADANDWPPAEIAAQVLAECCVEDGRFNNFEVGLLTVMFYLNRQLGDLGQFATQGYRDLVSIMNSGGSIESIRKWMQTHYP